MADPAIQRPKRRAIKILHATNPEWSSSSDENTPTNTHFTKPSSKPHVTPNLPIGEDSDSDHADAESSQRQSVKQSPNVRRPFSSIHQASPSQRSVTKERVTVAVTSDAENYVVVDLTGHTYAQAIRERILSKLHIPEDLHPSFAIYRTELGGLAIGAALDDNQLLIDCQHLGDDKGTLKFLAQRVDALSESPDGDVPVPLPPPTIAPVLPSLSSFSPGAVRMPSSRRPGSVSPASDRLASDGYGALVSGVSESDNRGQDARSPIQTLHRHQASRRGRQSTSWRVRRRGPGSDSSDMSPIAPQLPIPPDSSPEYLSNNRSPSSVPTISPHVTIPSHPTHSPKPSEPDSAYEREMAMAAEERRREEERERWMAKQKAELVSKRQQWARDHLNFANTNPDLRYQNGVATSARIPHGVPTTGVFPPNRTGSPMGTPNIHRLTDAQQQPQAPRWQQDPYYGRQPHSAKQPEPGGQSQSYHQQPHPHRQLSELYRPSPLPPSPRQTILFPRYNDSAQQLHPQSANDVLPPSFHPGLRPTMQRLSLEYDRPSPSDLYRPPPLPRTPQRTTLPLTSDDHTAPPSTSSEYMVGYTGHARDTDSNHDSTPNASESDMADSSSEVGSLEADNYHKVATIQRTASTDDEPGTVTHPIPTAPSRSQSTVPATNPQLVYAQPRSNIISRDFAAAVQEESDEDSGTLRQVPKQNSAPPATSTGTTAGITAMEPSVLRIAIRPMGPRLRVDGSRPKSHPDSSPSSTQDNGTSGFVTSGLPLDVRKKTTASNVGTGSGNGGEVPSRPSLQPQISSARGPPSRDIRPQAEEVYEKLDQLFPNHDSDKSVIDAHSGGTSPVVTKALPMPGPVAPLIGGSGVKRHKKPIRVVAAERKKMLERTDVVKQPPLSDSATPQASRTLRKRSTKMWGGRVEEFAPGSAPPDVSTVPEGGLVSQRPTFKWVKGQLLGEGRFGRVYHAMNLTTGEMIAAKQVELPKTDSDNADSRQMSVVNALKLEGDILKDLDHPHIVQYLGFEETMDVFSLFMEYVPGGSIGGFLRKVGKFEDEVVRSFSHQIIDGLAYLHKCGILHRDLKGDSILVDRSGICKISDFTISKRSEHVYINQEGTMIQGSVFWTAPEAFHNNEQGYSAKIDIWSIGCVVLEMQAGQHPWTEDDTFAVMYKVGGLRQAPPVPNDVILSPLADDFRRKCFAIDPAERPTAAELLTHPWLQLPPGWVFKGFKERLFPSTTNSGTTGATNGPPLVRPTGTPQSNPISDIVREDIAYPSKMSIHEMFEYLTRSGCPDLTQSINPNGYSKRSIATGGFGDIYKGKLKDGTPIAIKVWRSRALDEELGKDGKRAMREIYNWSQLDHENVQKLLGVVVFDERLGMVSKWMERGNLQEYLQKNPDVDGYPLCIQVAQGVEYIHDRNMIHGDLKAINVLVSSDHKLKLTDFDYSIMAESTVFSQTTRLGGGTLRWMAPELVLDLEGDHQRNKRTDIYALGMTFLETISRAVPYYPQCKTDGGVFAALGQKRFPQRDPSFFGSDQRGDRMWALLMRCWNHDPAARPIAAEVTVLLQRLVRETESINTA